MTGPAVNSRFRTRFFGALTLMLSSIPIAGIAQTQVATADKPEFVLLGTARIGDRYSAILRHREGKLVIVRKSDLATALPSFDQYSVRKIESGKISLQLPSDMTCFEFQDLGVSCDGTNIAALELSVGVLDRVNALTPRQLMAPVAIAIDDIPAERGTFIDVLQSDAQKRGQTAIVPPGMEMISTPSGFRLVPAD